MGLATPAGGPTANFSKPAFQPLTKFAATPFLQHFFACEFLRLGCIFSVYFRELMLTFEV
jgi:hypothetical protein